MSLLNIALVCIAKNEDRYIDEWIDYHLTLGFNRVHIYANDWNYANNSGYVTITNIAGKNQQRNAYNDFIKKYNHEYNWAAFFDVDEFLVLKKHENLQNFLSDYKECQSIGINWAIFGNNGHKKIINNNYSVLSRFTKRSTEKYFTNTFVKNITQLPTKYQQDIHNPDGPWYNLNKKIRFGSFNKPVDWSVAQINHYFTKSDEEFMLKCKRGRADSSEIRMYFQHLDNMNCNAVDDYAARDSYFLRKQY